MAYVPKGSKRPSFRRNASASGRSDRRSGGRTNSNRFERKTSRGDRRQGRPQRSTVNCDSCQKQCEVPFKPTSNKPVYCNDCFKGSAKSSTTDLSEITQKLDVIIQLLQK